MSKAWYAAPLISLLLISGHRLGKVDFQGLCYDFSLTSVRDTLHTATPSSTFLLTFSYGHSQPCHRSQRSDTTARILFADLVENTRVVISSES